MEIKVDVLGRFGEFGSARTVIKDGIKWYCANDICDILLYAPSGRHKIIKRYCRNVILLNVPTNNKGVDIVSTPSNNQSMKFINRDDIFRLLDHSQMPKAEKFRQWLFGDVIPSIEYTGAYVDPEALNEIKIDPIKFINRYEESKVELRDLRKLTEKQTEEINKLKEENKEKEIKINIIDSYCSSEDKDLTDYLEEEIKIFELINEENERREAYLKSNEANLKRVEADNKEKDLKIAGLEGDVRRLAIISNLYKQFSQFQYPERLQNNSIPLIQFV